jgi:hypothetical protein
MEEGKVQYIGVGEMCGPASLFCWNMFDIFGFLAGRGGVSVRYRYVYLNVRWEYSIYDTLTVGPVMQAGVIEHAVHVNVVRLA